MKHTAPWRSPVIPGEAHNIAPRRLSVDAVVIGAGIAGLTTAYLLALDGRRVTIIDDGAPGAGETGSTSAHLCNALDDRFRRLERLHGADGARLAAESHTAAIAMIESIVNELRIPCDFRRVDGYLFLPPGGDRKALQAEFLATHRAGLYGVREVDTTPAVAFGGPALLFPDQAQF